MIRYVILLSALVVAPAFSQAPSPASIKANAGRKPATAPVQATPTPNPPPPSAGGPPPPPTPQGEKVSINDATKSKILMFQRDILVAKTEQAQLSKQYDLDSQKIAASNKSLND